MSSLSFKISIASGNAETIEQDLSIHRDEHYSLKELNDVFNKTKQIIIIIVFRKNVCLGTISSLFFKDDMKYLLKRRQ